MNIQIYRTNASSYQDSQFFQREKDALEKIPRVRYIKSLNEMKQDEPFILLTNTHTQPEKLPAALLEKTVLIIHPNSGHDNFSPEFLEKSSFPIVLGNPIRSHAVAEYTMSTLFQHFTKIDNHLHWDDNRQWNRKLLRDQKALIIGHGHIGKILSRSLEPLCSNVTVYDPYVESSFPNENFITQFNLAMFEGVQLLILAASLNSSSHHMINQQVFKLLDPECIIINPARGPLIKEEDLILFLQKNPKAYAYLDVFEMEPFKPGYLHDLKNVNKTSHIAGVYEKLNKDIINFEYHIIKEFVAYLENQTTENFKVDYQSCLLSSRLKNNMLI